jgi:hypothetical protein
MEVLRQANSGNPPNQFEPSSSLRDVQWILMEMFYVFVEILFGQG